MGLGFRTNREGLRQLSCILGPEIEIVPVELPYYHGPDACLHLMSLISLVGDRLAVVYPPLIPVSFWEELRRREIQTVEVPEAEFSTMGCNVLALAPRDCLMLEGNLVTRARLERVGCSVRTYRGREISLSRWT